MFQKFVDYYNLFSYIIADNRHLINKIADFNTNNFVIIANLQNFVADKFTSIIELGHAIFN